MGKNTVLVSRTEERAGMLVLNGLYWIGSSDPLAEKFRRVCTLGREFVVVYEWSRVRGWGRITDLVVGDCEPRSWITSETVGNTLIFNTTFTYNDCGVLRTYVSTNTLNFMV